MNYLYYGDNLDILKRYVADECVDLIYLDPPFNSNQTYNVLFQEHDGSRAASQIKAFEDTWHWDQAAAQSYDETLAIGGQVAEAMRAFQTLLGFNDMLAYLSMMAPRLVELRRVLKPTGSLYLHCDPAASHYLKLLLDAVFGRQQFRNEIIWKRTTTHSDSKTWSRVSDTILFYSNAQRITWNTPHAPHSDEYIASKYRNDDGDGRLYTLDNMTSPNPRPNMMYEWKGFSTPSKGWRYSKETMARLDQMGRIWYPTLKDGTHDTSRRPRLKRYLDEMKGGVMGNVWADIPPINSQARERLGYPTQKPLALLERIIKASSNEGDIVLDPFCGCGTTITAAQKLGRRWIGIDVTHLAVSLIRHRLRDAFDKQCAFEVIGEPTTLQDARTLAQQDPYQFQWWALGLVGARPVEQKKGADRGIDGRLYFHDEGRGAKTKQVIFSVKAGRVTVSQVRDLVGVLSREAAQIGVFISLEPPTAPMRQEAASVGFYESPAWGKKYPRLQLLSIEALLSGQDVDYPRAANMTFKRAQPVESDTGRKQGKFRL